jgi:hypothetical protein
MHWRCVLLSLSFFLLATDISRADTIQVNGTCERGICGSPDVINLGSSISTPFDFTYRFDNSDTYRLQGESGGFYNSSLLALTLTNFIVTYLGNDTGTASANDVLDNNFTQAFGYDSGGNGFYTVNLYGTFGPGLGFASSASATGYDRGRLIASLGPVSQPAGDFFVTKTVNIVRPAGDPVLDYHYILDFGAGSAVGSSIDLYQQAPSPVPEPPTILLVGSAILCLVAFRRRLISRSTPSCHPVSPQLL